MVFKEGEVVVSQRPMARQNGNRRLQVTVPRLYFINRPSRRRLLRAITDTAGVSVLSAKHVTDNFGGNKFRVMNITLDKGALSLEEVCSLLQAEVDKIVGDLHWKGPKRRNKGRFDTRYYWKRTHSSEGAFVPARR